MNSEQKESWYELAKKQAVNAIDTNARGLMATYNYNPSLLDSMSVTLDLSFDEISRIYIPPHIQTLVSSQFPGACVDIEHISFYFLKDTAKYSSDSALIHSTFAAATVKDRFKRDSELVHTSDGLVRLPSLLFQIQNEIDEDNRMMMYPAGFGEKEWRKYGRNSLNQLPGKVLDPLSTSLLATVLTPPAETDVIITPHIFPTASFTFQKPSRNYPFRKAS